MAERYPQPTSEQISSLAEKMESWSQSLPEEEQLLLGVILARAKTQSNQSASAPEAIFPAGDVREAAEYALRTLLDERGVTSQAQKAWVRGGDDWMQWSSRQY